MGLVYVGLATPRGLKAEEYRLRGDREVVKVKASQAALDVLRRYLLSN